MDELLRQRIFIIHNEWSMQVIYLFRSGVFTAVFHPLALFCAKNQLQKIFMIVKGEIMKWNLPSHLLYVLLFPIFCSVILLNASDMSPSHFIMLALLLSLILKLDFWHVSLWLFLHHLSFAPQYGILFLLFLSPNSIVLLLIQHFFFVSKIISMNPFEKNKIYFFFFAELLLVL